MSDSSNTCQNTNSSVEVRDCDQELIHLVARVQDHGATLVVRVADARVVMLSENAPGLLGISPAELAGQPLDAWLRGSDSEPLGPLSVRLRSLPLGGPTEVLPQVRLTADDRCGTFDVSAHRLVAHPELAMLELEPMPPRPVLDLTRFHAAASRAVQRIQQAENLEQLYQRTAEHVRELTGYDRVMVYQFGPQWHGRVLAESRDPKTESYLNHHFPAGDIPEPVRQQYVKTPMRLIVDATRDGARLLRLDADGRLSPPEQPLDQSLALLRGVSETHLEFLRNMQVAGSMSLSLTRGEDLWGLLACHHREPKHLSYEVRTACELLRQGFNAALARLQAQRENRRRQALNERCAQIVQRMRHRMPGWAHVLIDDPSTPRPQQDPGGFGASGAALVEGTRVTRVGSCPPEAAIHDLVAWLAQRPQPNPLFVTDRLPEHHPPAADYVDVACGLLALRLAEEDWLLWFRPEYVQTLTWAGEPVKQQREPEGPGPATLHPRSSFASWRQQVRGLSVPWDSVQIEAARDLLQVYLPGALESARSLEQADQVVSRRGRYLQALVAVQARLLGSEQTETALSQVLAAIGRASGADRAGYFEVPPFNGADRPTTTAHFDAHADSIDVPELASFPEATCLAGERQRWTTEQGVAGPSPRRGEGLPVVPDSPVIQALARGDVVNSLTESLPGPIRTAMQRRGCLSVLLLPVHRDGGLCGLIGLENATASEPWQADEVELLRGAAQSLSLALSRQRKHQQLRQMNLELERRVAQRTAELTESRERLQLLLDRTDLGVFLVRQSGEVAFANRGLSRLLGLDFSLEQINVLAHPWHTVYPDGSPMPPEAYPISRALRTGEPVRNAVLGVYRPAAQEPTWLQVTAEPLMDAQSQQRQVLCSVSDITERTRVEEALRESEARWQLAVEANADGMYQWKPQTGEVFYSDNWKRMRGYEPHELPDALESWSNLLHPDDLRNVMQQVQAYLDGHLNKLELEYRSLHRDGTYRWIRDHAKGLFDEHGRCVRYAGTNTDITERKHAEQQLRLFESVVVKARDAVIITEPNPIDEPGPKILYVNRMFTEMTGYRPEEVIGQTPRILQGEKTNRRTLDRIRHSLRHWQSCVVELQNYKKDGEAFWAELSIFPVADDAGWVTHWVAIQRDISDRVRAQEEQRLWESKQAQFNRLTTVGEMASGIAHQLNQPLAAIKNYAQGCLMRLDKDRLKPGDFVYALGEIAGEAERAGAIIRGMRSLISRHEFTTKPTALNSLVREAVHYMSDDLRNQGVSLDFDLQPDLPRVHVDPILIQQIVINLVANARDAMLEAATEQPTVTIQTRWVDAGAEIRVRDNGPGLPDKVRKHLFEPFNTTKSQGIGVGLAICRSIAEGHMGRIWAEDDAKGGACFVLRLPAEACATHSR